MSFLYSPLGAGGIKKAHPESQMSLKLYERCGIGFIYKLTLTYLCQF